MNSKVAHEPSVAQLNEELREIKLKKDQKNQAGRLKELARSFAALHDWDHAIETFQLLSDEQERNILIADLIESFLLSSHEIEQAKKFAKYLTPTPEIQPLITIRIALAGNDREQAEQIARTLPSPLSRNFAFLQILESCFINNEKDKALEIKEQLLNNARTVYDIKSRSYILREIAIDLFLAHHEKEQAREVAQLIPDEKIKSQTLNKIGKLD